MWRGKGQTQYLMTTTARLSVSDSLCEGGAIAADEAVCMNCSVRSLLAFMFW